MSFRDSSGEDQLIAQLAALLPSTKHTQLSIGDDAAAIPLADGQVLLITTDLLMEDVHFRLCWERFADLGWKALAQNLSDIAAMGGIPTHAVIALAIPPQLPLTDIEELYRGIAELASQENVDIVGGDTIRSSGPMSITITVLGCVAPQQLLTRTGAHPGDSIYVTGTLGNAAIGLRLLDSGQPIPDDFDTAIIAQLHPTPRLAAARQLANSGLVSAMMDLSDGIATDLHRMCRLSHVGAVITATALPINSVVQSACCWLASQGQILDPLMIALTGGEDFELLFTAAPAAMDILKSLLAPLPVSCIGKMTDTADILLNTGDELLSLPWGFTHF